MTGTRAPRKPAADKSEEEFAAKVFQPRDLASYEGPLYVKNVSQTFVSFDDGKGNILKLGKPRSASTSDKYDSLPSITGLPPEIARHPGFQKFWRKGNVVVTNDPDIELELQEFADQDAEIDRLQQTYVNGLITKPQNATAIPAPFEIQGRNPNYPVV